MKNSFHAKPTTTTATTSPGLVFKAAAASNSAAVYRSLELPLTTPSPFPALHSTSSTLLFPAGLKPAQSKEGGEVVWQHVQHPPAPPGNFVFSKHCLDLSSLQSAANAVKCLNAALRKLAVDVQSHAAFVWKCSRCVDFVETEFVLRLFNTQVLDLQRVSGCAYEFNAIVHDLRSELLMQKEPCAPQKKFKPLPLPSDELLLEDNGAEASLLSLMDKATCASSVQVDVQREGLTKLARVLHEADLPAPQSCARRLYQVLGSSEDVQVRRLAVSALALVTTGSDHLAPSQEEGDVTMLINLVLDEREHGETRRQAARIIQQLVRAEKGAIPDRLTRPLSNLICHDLLLGEIVGDIVAALEQKSF